MKALIFTDRLEKGLSQVVRIVSSKNQLPILGNVLISFEGGNIVLTTTNLETAISTKLTAVVEKEGKTTVPAKQLFELISLIKDEKITISVTAGSLIIEGKKGVNKLTTQSPADFPPITLEAQKANIVIKEKELTETITQLSIATSQDENRPQLGGIRLGKIDNVIEVAATDGYRLSVKRIKTEIFDFENAFVFPVKTLHEVARIASEEKAKLVKARIIMESNQAVFAFETVTIITRLISSDFPPYQKIIPSKFTTRLVFDKEEMLNSIKIASIFARESANIVKLKSDKKNIIVSANAPSVGENKDIVEAQIEGEGVEIAFNYRFLMDMLSVMQTERVVLETTGSLDPGVFKNDNSTDFLHIIMPVRVQS
ncbi:DNA polymerase III subunit beta [Candidatus Gottesmanbacteria bacterium]|nr:DNA polymerase III subunit beta [Candidatus Gottesmanbacteria bacterium]